MATFGEKLRELRGELSRNELAERTGMLMTHIADLENGRYPNPTADTIYKLAKALGVGCEVFADCDFSKAAAKPVSAPRGRPKKTK